MKNYKIEHSFWGDEFWPGISFISVKGIPGKVSVHEIGDSAEREKIIQTWNNIAVMKATSDAPVKFYVGFSKDKRFQYLKHELSTDLEFGMRVGPEDVRFFALPVNFENTVNLELVELTTEDDPKYADLMLI